MKPIILAVILLCWSAVPALAQDTGRVSAIGGITFQTQPDALLGGEFGANLHPNLEIYGGVNFMRNVLPRSIQTDLDRLSDILTEETGNVWGFRADIRAFTGAGGVRFRVPTRTSFRAYMLAGGGLANIKVRIRERDLGEMTEDLLNEVGITDTTDTKPYLEVGGGLEFPVGALLFDAGYKFGRIVGERNLNTSRVYFGVGARF